jgi:hypothetical protein
MLEYFLGSVGDSGQRWTPHMHPFVLISEWQTSTLHQDVPLVSPSGAARWSSTMTRRASTATMAALRPATV